MNLLSLLKLKFVFQNYFINIPNAFVEDWLNLLNECLSYEVVTIRMAAISALPVLLSEFYSTPDKVPKHNEIINQYVSELLSTTSQIARMGHALALGALPKFMIQPNLEFIIVSLIESTLITPVSQKWAESRRDAVKALTFISTTMATEIGKGKVIFRVQTNKMVIDKIYFRFYKGTRFANISYVSRGLKGLYSG